MTPSAHLDSFARDNLPPRSEWPDFLFALPELDYPERMNCVVELLDRWIAAGDGDRPCLISPTETLSYAQLAERVNRIANALTRDLGLVAGHRVLLRGPNSPMMVAAYLAVIKAGGVVVATMPLLRAKEIAYPIAKAKIRLALCDHRLADEMEKARPLASDLDRVVYWGGGTPDALEALMAKPGYDSFHRLRHRERRRLPDRLHLGHHRRAQGHHAFPPRPAGDLRQLRPPRAARASRRPLHRLAAARLHVRARRARAVSAAHRRLDHPARKGRARRSARRHRQIPRDRSASPRRPPIARCWAKLAEHDISSLRKCVSAGEALPKATFDAWLAATGIKILDGIGATEMLHIFIGSPEDAIRPGATGKPVPGYEARVVDDDGNEVPPGTHRPPRRARADRMPLSRRRAPAPIRAERLEHHRRHLSRWMPTATSGTRRAPTT